MAFNKYLKNNKRPFKVGTIIWKLSRPWKSRNISRQLYHMKKRKIEVQHPLFWFKT